MSILIRAFKQTKRIRVYHRLKYNVSSTQLNFDIICFSSVPYRKILVQIPVWVLVFNRKKQNHSDFFKYEQCHRKYVLAISY